MVLCNDASQDCKSYDSCYEFFQAQRHFQTENFVVRKSITEISIDRESLSEFSFVAES